jgi:hypothetical protein
MTGIVRAVGCIVVAPRGEVKCLAAQKAGPAAQRQTLLRQLRKSFFVGPSGGVAKLWGGGRGTMRTGNARER